MVLSAEDLRSLMEYAPETGQFIWLKRTALSFDNCGHVAGGRPNDTGYVKISIGRKLYAAHRLAWLWVYGEWPLGDLDHINRDKADNRILNLRLASNSQNQANSPAQRNNKGGIKGVSWLAGRRKWKAHIGVNRRLVHLGVFDTAEAASAAYLAAAKKYYGEFASAD